jgi:hypothetical protein
MCARPALALSFVLLLLLAGPAQAQRAPAPDPSALAAATELQRTGATAEVVAREVMSTYRQSGPQMVQILSAVRYPTTDIGRAVAAETRSSTTTAASWLVQATMPGTMAYGVLFEMDRSSAATVRTMVGAGYSARDAVAGRQSIHPADLGTHASDLRGTSATPGQLGAAFGGALQAEARDAAIAMLQAGYSVLEVALALRDGYSLTPAQIGSMLVAENVSAPQVLTAFLDPAYGLAALEAVTAFRGFSGEAQQAAVLLSKRRQSTTQTATILTQAGYEVVAVGDALKAAYALRASAVVSALVHAGHTLTAASQWMSSEGVTGADAIVTLRGVGATAQENAAAVIASSIMSIGQPAPFTGWARQAGYDCAQVALALRHEFQSTIVAAAAYLVNTQCSADETAAALDGAYHSSTAALVSALTQAGLAPRHLVTAVVAAGHAVNATLSALLESPPGLTKEQVFPDVVCTPTPGAPCAPIPYPDVVAWLKQVEMTAADIATRSRNLGIAATEVAVALRDQYGATNVVIGNALAEAGYSALQAVIAFKDGIGLTLEQMTALATQLTYKMHEMQSAIMQNFDG